MSEQATTTAATTGTQGTQTSQKGQIGSNKASSNLETKTKANERAVGGGVEDQTSQEPRKYKLEKVKIRGKELDLDLDEDQLKRYVQQGYEANNRISEAKKLREEADQKFAEYEKWKASQEEHKKKITQDPIQAAIEAGASPQQVREIAEKWLLQQIQVDEMSPDAKKARELEAELKKRDEAEAQRRKQDEEAKLIQAAADERKRVVPEMLKAMDQVGVARTAANLSGIANRLKVAAARKTPMTIERAVQLQHEDNQSYVQSTMGGQAKALNDAYKANDFETVMKIGKEVESFIGEETLVALQRYGIVKFKSKTPSMPNQVIDTAKTKVTEEPSEQSWDDRVEERRRRAIELDRMRRGAVTGP